jgi:hypothetical protein
MGVIPPVPDPPRYRAFTITPTGNPKPSWALPHVKESLFPQSSLITELSNLQEKDKSSIADKIARLSGEQRASVYHVLVEVIAEDEDGGKGDRLEVEEERREWSVCEAVRIKGSKGRTRCVRVFFVKAPVSLMDKGKEGSEVSSMVSGTSASTERRGSEAGSVFSGKGKGKELANTSRSRSRGKEEEKEDKGKAVEKISKERRKSTREKEPTRESKGKGKEVERVEEKKVKRRSWKSRHRKKDYVDDDEEEDTCSCGSDSTISLQSHTRGLRRSKPRELSHRFKSRRSEVNPLSYGKAEEAKWEPPAIIPPQYPVRGYAQPQPQPQANEYHVRAAYEAGQRDALAERLRNAALDRRDLPQGPSHVISFERLRPGFEEWSEESYSPGYVEQAKLKAKICLPC